MEDSLQRKQEAHRMVHMINCKVCDVRNSSNLLSLVNLLNAPSSERFRDGSRGNENEGERDTHAQSDSKRRLKREQKPFFNHLDQVRTVLIHYNQILIRAAGFWLRCIQVAEWVETAGTSKLESRLEGTWKALGSRLEVSWKRLQNDHTRRELTDDRKTGGLGRRVSLERSYGNSHKREKSFKRMAIRTVVGERP